MKMLSKMKNIDEVFIFLVFWCGVTAGISGCTDKNKHKPDNLVEVKRTSPFMPVYPKSDWKPKLSPKNNKAKWAGEGFELVLKNECGKCKDICWATKNDPGSLTCAGVALARNPSFFSDLLNHSFHNCKSKGIYLPTDKKEFGIVKDICHRLRAFYWANYFKLFNGCSYSALIQLGDVAILQGPKAAIITLQRSHGLVVDGKWGPQSQIGCSKGVFNKHAYIKQRIADIKKYKGYKVFGKGWDRRIKNMGGIK